MLTFSNVYDEQIADAIDAKSHLSLRAQNKYRMYCFLTWREQTKPLLCISSDRRGKSHAHYVNQAFGRATGVVLTKLFCRLFPAKQRLSCLCLSWYMLAQTPMQLCFLNTTRLADNSHAGLPGDVIKDARVTGANGRSGLQWRSLWGS
jgi:hypothetical protein